MPVRLTVCAAASSLTVTGSSASSVGGSLTGLTVTVKVRLTRVVGALAVVDRHRDGRRAEGVGHRREGQRAGARWRWCKLTVGLGISAGLLENAATRQRLARFVGRAGADAGQRRRSAPRRPR